MFSIFGINIIFANLLIIYDMENKLIKQNAYLTIIPGIVPDTILSFTVDFID